MLALLALTLAPVELRDDGWIVFSQPAVAGTPTLGCAIDRSVSLQDHDRGLWVNGQHAANFAGFDVYMQFDDGALEQVQAYTPDCDVRDADIATRLSLDAAQGVALLAKHLEKARGEENDTDLMAVLAHIDHSRVDTLLAEIAAEVSREDSSQNALFWLAQQRGERGRAIVIAHLDERWPLEHREDAIMALALSEHPAALDTVRDVARNAAESALRAQAVMALGIVNAPGALGDLHSIFLTDDDDEVRTQAIFGLAQLDSAESAAMLAAIVRDPRHERHRREALFWLTQMDEDASQAVLDELVAEIF